MGRRAHKPDPALRRQVEAMAAYGIPEIDISRVGGIDAKTLRKHYREELDLGDTKANAQVAGFLFNSARSGNVTAQIFWLKTRAPGGKRRPSCATRAQSPGKTCANNTDEELMAIIGEGVAEHGLTALKNINAEQPAPAPAGQPAARTPRLMRLAR